MNEKRKQISNTLGMFDLIKGIIMLWVMLLHTYGLFDPINRYNSIEEKIAELGIPLILFFLFLAHIGSVAMPILFIIDGYGFRKTSMSKCIHRQYKELLIPFFTTVIITTIAHFLFFFFRYRAGIRYTAYKTLGILAGFLLGVPKDITILGFEFSACVPLWFLLALFIGNVTFTLLMQRFEGRNLLIASFAVSCVGWLIGIWITIPWCISQGLVAVLYICMGYLAKKNKFFTTPISKKTIICMWIITILTAPMNMVMTFNMAEQDYSFGPIGIASFGVFGILAIYYSLRLGRSAGALITFLRKIGRASLYVFCAHTIEIKAAGGYIHYDFANNWHGNIVVRSIIIYVVRVVVVLLGTAAFVYIKPFFLKKKEELLRKNK